MNEVNFPMESFTPGFFFLPGDSIDGAIQPMSRKNKTIRDGHENRNNSKRIVEIERSNDRRQATFLREIDTCISVYRTFIIR